VDRRIGRILISRDEIAARVTELGEAIGRDYAGRTPVLVGVLKGAVVFTADLLRAIPMAAAMDFMAVSSYGSGTRSTGVVRLTADLSLSIEDRDVIIVEDVIDSGRPSATCAGTSRPGIPGAWRSAASSTRSPAGRWTWTWTTWGS